jgi:hypothetical protein
MTSSHSYSRRRPSKTPRPSIVILVEGKVTEPEYLDALRKALGISKELVKIEKSGCTDANGIVGEARELLAKSSKKRGGESFDEVWVVADAESEHENGHQKISPMQSNKQETTFISCLILRASSTGSCCILSGPHVIFPQQLMSSLNFGNIGLDTPNRAGSSTGLPSSKGRNQPCRMLLT